ncbi:hypothetical protein BaRGS_00011798 [Batillaria attramentaria]|uniref:Uncharacterized protein n=1 Tax=Batillaria attramentaria TaxID=370345 RepID=A0ABD0LCP5_9CAEN
MMSHLARMARTCFPSIGRVSSLARRYSSRSDQSQGRMFEPSWKLGSDFFAKTWGQVTRPFAETMRDLMLSNLDSVPVPSKKGVFTIADYGTSDGYASMPLFTTMIAPFVSGKRGTRSPIRHCISGVHASVKAKTKEHIAGSMRQNSELSADSYLGDVRFADAIVHFLPGVTDEELRAFRKEAASQLEDFLLLRARELKPGGILVMMTFSSHDDYRQLVLNPDARKDQSDVFKKQAVSVYHWFADADQAWRELRGRNIITEEEYTNFQLPIAFRGAGEMMNPFHEVNSPVLQSGLSLEFHDQRFHPDPFRTAWHSLQRQGQSTSFGDYITMMYQAVTSLSVHGNLSRMRSEEEKQAIVEQYYAILRQMLADVHPDSYNNHVIISRLVARKTM